MIATQPRIVNAIIQLNPVTYDYNGKAGFSKTTGNIGIIAQDVMGIIPETISTYSKKLNEDDAEETVLYNFDSHAVTFMLINSIKELKAEIESVKHMLAHSQIQLRKSLENSVKSQVIKSKSNKSETIKLSIQPRKGN